jgi:Dimerisation domain/O-methyltransferase domain
MNQGVRTVSVAAGREIKTDTLEELEWKALSDVMNAFIRTEVLTAACRLGLFDYLAACPSATEADIAARFDLEPQGVRILLMGCRQAGLIAELQRGHYVSTRISARFLTSGSPESMLNFVSFVRDVQQQSCHTLLDSLRQKQPVGLIELGARAGETLYNVNSGLGCAEADFHAAMSEYSRMAQPPALPELARCLRLLDVGGGLGSVAHQLCLAHPHLACTVVELPTVSARVADRVAKGEISPRIQTAGIDVFSEPWPSIATPYCSRTS